jgi:hypothetical protein
MNKRGPSDRNKPASVKKTKIARNESGRSSSVAGRRRSVKYSIRRKRRSASAKAILKNVASSRKRSG